MFIFVIGASFILYKLFLHASTNSKSNSYKNIISSVYVIESPKHGDLPISFRLFFQSKGIEITNQYTMNTDMIFCRGHDLRPEMCHKLTSTIKLTYGLASGDFLTNKQTMARIPSKYTPISYHRANIDQLNPEDNEYCYIFKKNVQKQKGIQISTNQKEFEELLKHSDFDVVQEALLDPYLIDGRKINMRVYVMFVYDPIKKRFDSPVIYNNGFMYYCKERLPQYCSLRNVFPTEITHDNFITTGYIDRSVYETNPLTIHDMFGSYTGSFFEKVRHAVDDVFMKTPIIAKACEIENIADHSISSKGKRFLILGMDVAWSRSKNVKIMEINKGPDLNSKDSRDGYLKNDMVSYMMNHLVLN